MEQRKVENNQVPSLCNIVNVNSNATVVNKSKSLSAKFPLTFWEMAVASGVVLSLVVGLLCVYLTMPASDYSFLQLPRSLEDLQILRDPVFMSLLAGALFGVFKGVALVVFSATAGASSCYFLSKLIGRPLLSFLWPDKLVFFQAQVTKRRTRLLNYMLSLRVTPTLPNTFINVASPIVDVPYHIFFLATIISIIPAAYVTVQSFGSKRQIFGFLK